MRWNGLIQTGLEWFGLLSNGLERFGMFGHALEWFGTLWNGPRQGLEKMEWFGLACWSYLVWNIRKHIYNYTHLKESQESQFVRLADPPTGRTN